MVWWKRDLADPGSSTYDSNMLHVGDGTWDSGRDTYLLPPLMGVNFETMRYNGMGNRFKDDHNYKQLIAAHAVLAAIVFLFLIPPSIFVARFYTRQPYWAKRIHIGLQILSMFLLTASFVTGWFAVSPERRLTNPHHGIGLAIYVLMWFNMFCGWGVYLKLRGKSMMHSAFIAMFHRWIGRALALLGLAQIPLGLTLYGSPKALFILYALVVFTLLCLYFLLSYLEERRLAPEYSSTTTTTSTSPKHDGLPGPANATSHSGSDQSHTDRRRTRPTRYAEPAAAGAGAGAGAGVMGKIFGSNGPNYAPAPSQERPDRYDDSRLEEGRHAAHGAAQEQTELTEQDSEWDHHEHSHEHSHEHDHTGAKMVVGAGALYALSRFWKKRRARKGQKAEDVAEMRMVGDTETETQGLTRRASGRTARSQSRFRRGNSVGSSGEGSDSQTESGYTYGADGSRVTASNLTGDEISAIPNPKRRSRATGAEADDLSDAPNSRRRVSGKKHAGPADSAATTTTRTTTTTTSDSGQNVTLHLRKPRDNDNGQVTLRKLTPEEAAAKKKSKRSKGKDRDRERERRHRRGGSDDSGRRSSRSRSRPAVKHSGGAVFAGGPPSALNTISEVSTGSAGASASSSKDTAYRAMEAREKWEQQQMEQEERGGVGDPGGKGKGKGKQPVYAQPAAIPEGTEYEPSGAGAGTGVGGPPYQTDEYEYENENEVQLPPEAYYYYRPRSGTGQRPARHGDVMSPVSGGEGDGDGRGSRRDRRRYERRSREASVSRDAGDWE